MLQVIEGTAVDATVTRLTAAATLWKISVRGARLAADLRAGIAEAETGLFADLDPGEITTLERLLNRIKQGDTVDDCHEN